MTIKIHKFLKSDLSDVSSIQVSGAGLANTSGMTISHFACCVKSSEVTLPYTIEGVDKHIPYVDDVDFCVVIRKKVDLTATGVNEKEITDIGNDIGKYEYTDIVPNKPLDLPPEFKELYKKDK